MEFRGDRVEERRRRLHQNVYPDNYASLNPISQGRFSIHFSTMVSFVAMETLERGRGEQK